MALQWGYKRAFMRCALLVVVGAALQLVLGDFDNKFLRYPWGLIFAINYLYLLLLVYVQGAKWKWLQQLSDGYAMTSSLASLMVLTIIFGLTRQDPSTEGVIGALGFSRMTSSWVFIFVLFYFTTALGITVMRDIHNFKKVRLAALLSHVAVFVTLVAAIFGSADKQRVVVDLQLDRMTYMAKTHDGEAFELPFALTLKEFRMEEYPAKLYILDTQTEGSSQEFLLAEHEGAEAVVEGWHLEAQQCLEMATRMSESDEFRQMHHVGATPAVKVQATNVVTGECYEGWVSCGSHIFAPAYLWLGERYVVAMPQREAKRYLSRIEITDKNGEQWRESIEVNKPARIGSWRIYQVGYDTQRGRWSTSSVVECVRDGWWGVVQVVLWMMLAMGVVMFLTAGGSRMVKRDKEVKQ
ncbi:MAG: cytochrome c biogenesis protein ResB [Alistipes sp.]|nr:cytochrome c biogenesis protein ResB [Alistipes sp.]